MHTFVRRAAVQGRVDEALAAVKELLTTVCANREYLLAVLLAGKSAFLNECRRGFRGMAVDDGTFDAMWYYIRARRGPGGDDRKVLEAEYEWLIAQREQRENALKAEAAALQELDEKAHGKDAQAEIGKFGLN